MRAEDLRSGTRVNDTRVTGKKRVWKNGQPKIDVTFTDDNGNETTKTYNVGQNVPGSPRFTAAFLPASNTRKVHDGHQGRRTYPGRDESAQDRLARRNALRLSLTAA